MSKFANPYPSVNVADGTAGRVNADFPIDDYRLIQRIRVDRGTVQTTVNILLQKLIHELRKRGITDYTRVTDFEDFVVGCQLVYTGNANQGGDPAIRSNPEASVADERARASRPSNSNPTDSNVGKHVPKRGRTR